MKENKSLVCLRCFHSWKQRGKKKPKVCPCCKSKNWNTRSVKNMIKSIIG